MIFYVDTSILLTLLSILSVISKVAEGNNITLTILVSKT